MLDNRVNTLHDLEKRLDQVIAEYNACCFKRNDLIIECAETDDDTIRYDEIRREIINLNYKIYHCQERIRDLTLELAALRQEVYSR